MKSFLCIFLFLVVRVAGTGYEYVPVIIWGDPKVSDQPPHLMEWHEKELIFFLVDKILPNTLTLVFVEETLTPEDLSQCRVGPNTCFEYLSDLEPKTYFSSVHKPVKGLIEFAAANLNHVKFVEVLNGELTDVFELAESTIYFIYLQSLSYSFNDNAIRQIYDTLGREVDNILAIYTAQAGGVQGKKRQTDNEQKPAVKAATSDPNTEKEDFGTVFKSINALIYYKSIQIQMHSGAELENLTFTTAITTQSEDSEVVDLKLTGDKGSLSFNMEWIMGNWALQFIQWNDAKYEVDPVIVVNNRHSYHCTSNTYSRGFFEEYPKLFFTQLQIQPNFDLETKALDRFGNAFHCINFTSPSILSGLFVIFIVIIMLAISICCLMDVRSVDRFEDPHGPALTIIVAEVKK